MRITVIMSDSNDNMIDVGKITLVLLLIGILHENVCLISNSIQ